MSTKSRINDCVFVNLSANMKVNYEWKSVVISFSSLDNRCVQHFMFIASMFHGQLHCLTSCFVELSKVSAKKRSGSDQISLRPNRFFYFCFAASCSSMWKSIKSEAIISHSHVCVCLFESWVPFVLIYRGIAGAFHPAHPKCIYWRDRWEIRIEASGSVQLVAFRSVGVNCGVCL